MTKANLQTLKGFRDFLPEEARKRAYLIDILKGVFESFGFGPLETPTLEYEEILMGKYGEEGDKLMYRFEDNGKRRVALRYDQTVPLSRIIAQYQNDLVFPFKRYQIQPVWRAENTQKGRYREFLQCDIDIVGTNSSLSDTEILAVVYECFKKLGLPITIKFNDRALLKEFSAKALPTLDKLNKIGEEGVVAELIAKGFSQEEAERILGEAKALKPSANLLELQENYKELGYPEDSLEFDGTLIRGLDYYTGMILEVVLKDQEALSLGGGGRYDNLIGMFAGKQIPAVGFAFGFDRVLETMEELNLFNKDLEKTAVLVTLFSPELKNISEGISTQLRSKDIMTELYLDENVKMDKQLKYADKKGIPYVVIIGPEEVQKNTVKLKDMKTGDQEELSLEDLIKKLV